MTGVYAGSLAMTQFFSQTFWPPYGDLHQWQNDIQTVQQPKNTADKKTYKNCTKSTARGVTALRLEGGVVLMIGYE